MDETVGVGVGPAERAHHAGGDGPTPEPRRRMSARRKQETVLRLLRGEDLELISRDLAVTAAELSGWRDQFLAAGEASLKSRPADARDAEIGRLQAKVGELTMTAELLEAKIERLETHRPLGAGGRDDESAGLALHRPSLRSFAGKPAPHTAPTPPRASARHPPSSNVSAHLQASLRRRRDQMSAIPKLGSPACLLYDQCRVKPYPVWSSTRLSPDRLQTSGEAADAPLAGGRCRRPPRDVPLQG